MRTPLRRVTPEWKRLEELAAAESTAPPFDPASVASLPPAVRRYVNAAIAPGTPLAAGVRLTMVGSIKLGRWLPFRAHQLLVPTLGTVWVARVGGVISGSDRYVDGSGGMDWRLFGILRIVHAEGSDVRRSAADRAAGESIWTPTAVARYASFIEKHQNRIGVTIDVDGRSVELEHEIDDSGTLTSSSLRRWGDPDGTGTWAEHSFGVEVTGSRNFGGVTVPHRGRAGWHFGTDRWEQGVFFRYELTGYELLG